MDPGCAQGTWSWLTSSHSDVYSGKHGTANRSNLIWTIHQIVFIIAVGTFVFKEIENVSLIKAFYWCCVTVTTVGYGDVVPLTEEGKAFAIGYILIGTFLMAKALADIASLPLEIRRLQMEATVLSQYGAHLSPAELAEIADDKGFRDLGLRREMRGHCTKTEFVVSMLLKLKKIDEADVKRCVDSFKVLDVNNDGRLNDADIAKAKRG